VSSYGGLSAAASMCLLYGPLKWYYLCRNQSDHHQPGHAEIDPLSVRLLMSFLLRALGHKKPLFEQGFRWLCSY
jgi:hypothetical protein